MFRATKIACAFQGRSKQKCIAVEPGTYSSQSCVIVHIHNSFNTFVHEPKMVVALKRYLLTATLHELTTRTINITCQLNHFAPKSITMMIRTGALPSLVFLLFDLPGETLD